MSERDNAPEEVGEKVDEGNNVLSLVYSLEKMPENLDDMKFSKKVKKGLLTIESSRVGRYLVFIKKDKDGNETKIVLDEILGDESDSKIKFGVGDLFNVNKLFTYNDNIYGEIGAGRDKLSYLVFSLFSLPTILFSPTLGFSLLGSALIMRKKRVSSVLSLLGILSDAIFPISLPDFIGLFMLLASLYMAKKGTSSNKITKVYNSLGDIGSKYLPFNKALLVSNFAYLNNKYSEVTEELGDDTGTVIYSPLTKVISIRIKKEDGSYFSPLLFDDLLDNSVKLLSKVKVKIVGYERMDPFINFRFKIDPKDKKNLLNKLLSIEKKGKKVTLARILSLSLGFAGSHVNTYLGELNLSFKDLDYINGKYVGAKEHKLYKLLKVNEGAYLSSFLSGNPLKKILSREEDVSFCLIYINGRFYFPARHVEIKKGKYVVSDPVFVDGRNFFVKRNYFVNVEGITTRLIKEGKIKVKLIGTYLDNRILTNNMPSEDNLNIAYILEVNSGDVKKELKKFKKKISS